MKGRYRAQYLQKTGVVKDCKKSIIEANDAVWGYKSGNLSPSVLTESKQSEA